MIEGSFSVEANDRTGLTLAELPVSSKFAGGGNVYLKIAPDAAVEIRFGRKGEVVGYGSSMPLDQFPDARFDPMDGQEVMACQAEHRLPTVGQGLMSAVRQCLGDILHRFSWGSSKES
ncbi:TPA: hypothetical protein DCL30_05670 [Candidatus Peribacteria bacterium]|nr:MAG: hypothetical protein A3J91_01485 [Candidatus Peribacteria bacterium RIFOXYC2_FULL_58_10]OGJ84945.1 MAG: hypothetical protein A2529_00370 [Candidatus Peribacteria bacterium RIFOXYD2_FULL_58_15]HAI98982.1 hypothetical protein [Candidatus Peribacteria bacterium]HAS34787.1 hypothetical protein [Candidatus Peribacteria bacterium]